uniref:Camp independent regulatory protein n=1 Tax=Colletotrichum fructicola (strain Nara gc5) TaxID=1213859 RepID=L2FTG8_COLFN
MLQPTYEGLARTLEDVTILFEACNKGLLTPLLKRPVKSDYELIRPGHVFVWDPNQVGIQRWRDGMRWGPGRDDGVFTTYQQRVNDNRQPLASGSETLEHGGTEGASRPGMLTRQACYMKMPDGSRMRLVQYYDARFWASNPRPPSEDEELTNLRQKTSLFNISTMEVHKSQRNFHHFPYSSHASPGTTSSILSDKQLLSTTTNISVTHAPVVPLFSENQPKVITEIPIDPLLMADTASQCFSITRDAETDPILPNEEDGVLEYLAPEANFGELTTRGEEFRGSSLHFVDCSSASQPGVIQD